MKKVQFQSSNAAERKRMEMLEKLFQVRDYLEKNYRSRPTDKELAELVQLDEVKLIREYKRSFFLTPQEFVDAYRAQDSEATLVRSTMKVENIAKRFGFSSLEAYRRAFQKEFDDLPEAYREKHRYDPKWTSRLQFWKDQSRRSS